MPHDVSLITTIAAALGLAMAFGFLAVRLRMPPLAGYLLAGIVIGPHTRGFVADIALASQLAEIGVIAEENREVVEALRGQGVHAVTGNASDPAVLIQAHVARAAMLVVATPDTVGVRKMIKVARRLNPEIQIVLRTHSDEEAEMLRNENAGVVFMGEHELASAMTRHVIARMSTDER